MNKHTTKDNRYYFSSDTFHTFPANLFKPLEVKQFSVDNAYQLCRIENPATLRWMYYYNGREYSHVTPDLDGCNECGGWLFVEHCGNMECIQCGREYSDD